MRLFSIVTLLVMAACDGGNTDTDSDDTGDDTASEAKAELVVNSAFLTKTEPCKVVINDDTVGNTGETILITPDVALEVEVGILDGPRTTDNLPLHTLGPSWDETVWAGASVVTPKHPVTGEIGTPQTIAASFNLWQADTWWTCNEVRSWDGGSDSFTAMSYYHDGNKFFFEFGEVTVDGVNFQIDSSFTGQFISPTEATAIWQQTDTAYVTVTCFTSDENGTKVDADGNPA